MVLVAWKCPVSSDSVLQLLLLLARQLYIRYLDVAISDVTRVLHVPVCMSHTV